MGFKNVAEKTKSLASAFETVASLLKEQNRRNQAERQRQFDAVELCDSIKGALVEIQEELQANGRELKTLEANTLARILNSQAGHTGMLEPLVAPDGSMLPEG